MSRPPMGRARANRRALLLLVPAVALALLAYARMTTQEAPVPSGSAQASARQAPAETAAAAGAPEIVTVGFYLQNIPDIDVKTNSFAAEFYLWFLWNGSIDPTLTYQLTNALGVADLSTTPVYTDASGSSAPDLLPDGRRYQVFHVYGRFSHPFPLAKYPFDDHDIVISLEDAKYDATELVHQVDVKGTTLRPDLLIPGWSLGAMRPEVGRSHFATTFGDPRTADEGESYSRVAFSVHISRPPVGMFWTTVVPIAIIIIMTMGAFFISPEFIDARLCLTITALISAVAMQFTAATELPPTGYLLLLDKIYLLSYALIVGVSSFCIAAHRRVNGGEPVAAARLDRVGLWALSGSYVGTLVVLIIYR